MNTEYRMMKLSFLISSFLLIFLVTGCTQTAESCPSYKPIDLSEAGNFADNEKYPFQFPLDDPRSFTSINSFMTGFAAYGRTTRGPEYHAAEDLYQPAGTAVYAMADGRVSFSGRMGGYGWLIIIDHPQANIYSLYGHLSPSRWEIGTGEVKKGELIGYLGDSDENGGSSKRPLITHLHFGVRSGQRMDYPGMGDWRWQAGWIKPCPQEMGWLQPSLVINSQDIHYADSHQTKAGFLSIWWIDILFTGVYVFGGVCVTIFAAKTKKFYLLIYAGILMLVLGVIFVIKGMVLSYWVIFALAILLLMLGVYYLIYQPKRKPSIESE